MLGKIEHWTNFPIRRTSEVINFLNPKTTNSFFRQMSIYNSLIEENDKVQNIVSQMTGEEKDFSLYCKADSIKIQPIILLEHSLDCAHNIFTKMEVENGHIYGEEYQLLQLKGVYNLAIQSKKKSK